MIELYATSKRLLLPDNSMISQVHLGNKCHILRPISSDINPGGLGIWVELEESPRKLTGKWEWWTKEDQEKIQHVMEGRYRWALDSQKLRSCRLCHSLKIPGLKWLQWGKKSTTPPHLSTKLYLLEPVRRFIHIKKGWHAFFNRRHHTTKKTETWHTFVNHQDWLSCLLYSS